MSTTNCQKNFGGQSSLANSCTISLFYIVHLFRFWKNKKEIRKNKWLLKVGKKNFCVFITAWSMLSLPWSSNVLPLQGSAKVVIFLCTKICWELVKHRDLRYQTPSLVCAFLRVLCGSASVSLTEKLTDLCATVLSNAHSITTTRHWTKGFGYIQIKRNISFIHSFI